MKRVAILGDGTKEVIRSAAREIGSWLDGRAELALTDLEGTADLAKLEADFALVLGGDGFILFVARRLAGNPVPVMGINFGKLGFIAEFNWKDAKKAVSRALEGEFVVSPRTMLRVAALDGRSGPWLALNDAVISRGGNPRMICLDLKLDGGGELKYTGDGLILSTPTGSTAYSLSAGGPVLVPEMEGLVLTPLCPQVATTRPLVIHASTRLEVRVVAEEMGAVLTIDGQDCAGVESGDVLAVEAVPGGFCMLRDPDRGFLDILQEKLSWGGMPLYRQRFQGKEER